MAGSPNFTLLDRAYSRSAGSAPSFDVSVRCNDEADSDESHSLCLKHFSAIIAAYFIWVPSVPVNALVIISVFHFSLSFFSARISVCVLSVLSSAFTYINVSRRAYGAADPRLVGPAPGRSSRRARSSSVNFDCVANREGDVIGKEIDNFVFVFADFCADVVLVNCDFYGVCHVIRSYIW